MTLDEKALEAAVKSIDYKCQDAAIACIRAYLEAVNAEPVGFVDADILAKLKRGDSSYIYASDRENIGIPLYTHPAPAHVTVKKLEWDQRDELTFNGHNKRRILARSLTPFIAYFIEHDEAADEYFVTEFFLGKVIAGPFNNEPDAIAAAQADCERRVLSLLDRHETPVRETQAESKAAHDVLTERRRQIETEGWTPEHDDTHTRGEILTAAWCYMQRHADKDMFGDSYDINKLPPPARWPWNWVWWKPKDRRRDLVKAGALILAEIERLDRLAAAPTHGGSDA